MFRSRQSARRLLTAPVTGRLRLEPLEDRATPATLFVDDSFTITNDTAPAGLSAGDTVTFAPGESGQTTGLTFGTTAFSKIQDAVNASKNVDTIRVATGTYNESNITVAKAVTIQGESRTGTVLAPAAADSREDSSFGGTVQNGFVIRSDDVTIRALTIDGNANASLAGKNNFRAGVITDFTVTPDDFDRLTVTNTTIQNVYRRGVQISDVSTGASITGNTIDNVELVGNGAGIITFGGSGTISGNTITNAFSGVSSNFADPSAGTGPPTLTVQNNQVTVRNGGIGLQLFGLVGTSTVSGNTVNLATDSAADIGILIADTRTGPVSVTGNKITAAGGDLGILVSDAPTAAPVSITGNTLTATGSTSTSATEGVAILLTDDNSLTSSGSGDVNATVGTNTISGFVTGLSLIDTATGGGAKTNVNATVTDQTLNGLTNGLVVTGGGGKLDLTNVRITNNTGKSLSVANTGGTVNLTDLTLTGNGSPATITGGTVNYTATATTPTAFAVSGTELRVTPGTGPANQAISLSGVTAVSVTGGSGADTFQVVPASSGGPVITVNGGGPAGGTTGDVLDIIGGSGLNMTSTSGANGFSGTATSASTAAVNFTGFESLTGGATISGTMFNDKNANGKQDTGETGVAGVSLFLDGNGNGKLDSGELTATTDATGAFTFSGLPSGNVTIRATAPTSGTVTTTNPQTVTATFGSTTQNVTFGVNAPGGAVTGTVFNDLNRNGTQDAGEPGVSGVTVFLDANGNGTRDTGEATTTTGTNGGFTLTSSTNGTFAVTTTAPTGFSVSTAPASVTLSGGDTVSGKNVALTATAGGSVTGTVFTDANTNGTQDTGETGVSGVTVFLDLNGNGKQDTGEPSAVTGTNGGFTITTTANTSGQVTVRAVPPTGSQNPATLPQVTVTGGNTVTGQNLGLIAAPTAPAGLSKNFAAGFISGGRGVVREFDQTGKQIREIDVSDIAGSTPPRVAVADINGDGTDDIVIGTGPGVSNRLRIIDGSTGKTIFDTSPFEATFIGGLYVAVGDLNRDGVADVIVTPDEGGGPRVEVYSFASSAFTLVANFFGIDDPAFRGGARASVGDFNNDGTPDLVVAAGFGGGPRIAVYDGTTIVNAAGTGVGTRTKLFNDIFVFEQALRNGVFVAAGDVNGDGKADLIAGGGPGGGPRVLVLSGADLTSGNLSNPTALANFFGGDVSNRGGIRVTTKNLDGDNLADLVVGSGTAAGSRVTAYLGKNLLPGTQPAEQFAFDTDPAFSGGVFVG